MKFFSNNSLAIITVKIPLNLVRLARNWNDGINIYYYYSTCQAKIQASTNRRIFNKL